MLRTTPTGKRLATSRTTAWLLTGVLALVGLAACDAERAPTPNASSVVATPSGAPTPEAPAYTLDVDDWEGPVGEEGYVTVAVVAQGEHKINAKYPQRITLDAPPKGLDLPLRRLSMTEGQLESDKRLVFTVPATPTSAGNYQLHGAVRLSVCNASECKTVKEKLRARVVAQ